MPTEPRGLGPSAARLAANLREVRRAARLDLAQVSARLDDQGQAISLGQLSKTELGTRRVDVDDLVALAVALDVTPNRLLLTAAADDHEVHVTPSTAVTAQAAWRWAAGQEPLPRAAGAPLDLDAWEAFRAACAPHEGEPDVRLSDLEAAAEALAPVLEQARLALAGGVRLEVLLAYLRLAAQTDALRSALPNAPAVPDAAAAEGAPTRGER